jgi:fucose permease
VVLGPVIPFLSEWYDLSETSFTYLFICRSVGFCLGSILMAFLLRRYSYYPILRVTVVIAGLMFILFPFWRSLWGHGFCIVVASIFCSGFEIVMNMCIIALYKHNRVDFWLQIMHGMFGVGGLIGPLFVRAWGVYGCVAIGIGCIVALPGYFLLPTPESVAL